MIVHGEGDVLVPAHLNFGKFILDRLRKVNPDDTCLLYYMKGEKMTYGEFTQHAVRLAAALAALGAGRGHTVAVASEPRIVVPPTCLAIVFTGAAYTPIELECGRAVLMHKFNLTRPEYVICSRLFWEAYSDILKGFDFVKTFICFDDIEEIELSVETLASRHRHVDVRTFEPAVVSGATDVALVVYSSGTSGMSKGVMLTHLNCIVTTNINVYDKYELLQTGFITGDLYSRYFIFVIYYFLSTGKRIVCSDSENIKDLQVLENYQVNIIPGVPVFVEDILDAERSDQFDLSSLKLFFCAGGRLPPKLAEAFKQRYPNIKLLNFYGTTETSYITTQELSHNETSAVGFAVSGVTLKVVDVKTRATLGPNHRGEICVRSPYMMKGYLGASLEYLDEEGFFLTGDLGYYDEQERFYLVDRLKDVISYVGFQICPGEVEAVLLRHGAVREAAVAGKPAGAHGETPVAFVMLQPGASATEAELVDYVAKEVTWYMRLAGGVRFMPELPRGARGKLLRRRLREMLELEENT